MFVHTCICLLVHMDSSISRNLGYIQGRKTEGHTICACSSLLSKLQWMRITTLPNMIGNIYVWFLNFTHLVCVNDNDFHRRFKSACERSSLEMPMDPAVGWPVSPKKIWWSPNPWYLWLWHLEVGFLQMWLVKMKSYWIRLGPKSNDWCPYKKAMRRHRHTERRMPCEDEDRDCSNASTSQGTPRIAGRYQELERGMEQILP